MSTAEAPQIVNYENPDLNEWERELAEEAALSQGQAAEHDADTFVSEQPTAEATPVEYNAELEGVTQPEDDIENPEPPYAGMLSAAERRGLGGIIGAKSAHDLPEGPVRSSILSAPGMLRGEKLQEVQAAAKKAIALNAEVHAAGLAEDDRAIKDEETRYVTANADMIDAKIEAALVGIKPGSVEMMREGLRERFTREESAARRMVVEANGGAKGIDELVKREAAEAAAEEARASVEAARQQQEREAAKIRIQGYGSNGDALALNDKNAPKIAESRNIKPSESIRPPHISKKDWLSMSWRDRQNSDRQASEQGVTSTDPEMRALEHVAALERTYGRDMAGMTEADKKNYDTLLGELEDVNKDSEFTSEQLEEMWRARIDMINGFDAVTTGDNDKARHLATEVAATPNPENAKTGRTAEELTALGWKPSPVKRYQLVEIPPAPDQNAGDAEPVVIHNNEEQRDPETPIVENNADNETEESTEERDRIQRDLDYYDRYGNPNTGQPLSPEERGRIAAGEDSNEVIYGMPHNEHESDTDEPPVAPVTPQRSLRRPSTWFKSRRSLRRSGQQSPR